MSTPADVQKWGTQYRSAVIEDIDTQKSEMYLKAVPYGQPTDIGGGITEEFRPGTFSRAAKDPSRLSLWRGHGGAVIGRGMDVEDRAEGVWLRMKLGRTQEARDAILDYEDGIASDPSIEFVPMFDWMTVTAVPNGLSVVHRRAQLLGSALVPVGAYSGKSWVESIREDDEKERAREEARLWLAEYRRRTVTV